MPVVLYDCETWSLTLREESRLKVFENRILRQISGPKRDENGEWRWAGHVARMEEGRSAFKILTGNLQERDLWGGLGVDRRTILEWTLKKKLSIREIELIRLDRKSVV